MRALGSRGDAAGERRRRCRIAPTATSSRSPAGSSTPASRSVGPSPADSNRIYTVARIAVLEDLTGVDESIVEVRELGGRIGIDEMFVAARRATSPDRKCSSPGAAARPAQRRAVVLRLPRRRPEGVTGAETGVVRFAAGLEVLGEQAESRRTRTLAEMRTIVAAIKGVQPVRPAAVPGGCRARCASRSRSRCSTALALAAGGQRRPPSTGTGTSTGRIRSPAATSIPRSPPRSAGVDRTDDREPDPGAPAAPAASAARPTCSTSVNAGAGLISF